MRVWTAGRVGAALSSLLLLLEASDARAQNLVQNPGFDGGLTGWTTAPGPPVGWDAFVGNNAPGSPIGGPALDGQQTRTLAVAGNCGIPSTAKAVSVNLAVTQSTATGNVRLFPTGQAVPTVSSINYGAGETRANNAVVKLDANGALDAFVGQAAGTTVDLILDVNGYFQ